jgi:tripartite-type tricarboxylate transporter receptor subunit TctC
MNGIKSTWAFNGGGALVWVQPILFLLVVFLCIFSSRIGLAQEVFPNKPIRLVVPYPPGGTGDSVARILAPAWSDLLKQTIIVENRGGAGSNIGADYVAKAAPDGYTLLLFDSALAINATLYAKLPYDVARDLTPIMVVGKAPLVLVVNPSFPAKSLGDLIKMVRTNPAGFSYASAGSGSPVHLAAEMFKVTTGLDIVHVPYKGTALVYPEMFSGSIQILFDVPVVALPFIKQGRVRALGVSGKKRINVLPEVPTISESGLAGFQATNWYGLFAPGGTPRDVVAKINTDTNRSITAPDIRDKIINSGGEPLGGNSEDFAAFLKNEIARSGKTIKEANIKFE